ncbi:OLC1v1021484C2 [Oldenlandia corymbosa var. corymbosa]|uniref:OLC1v1021484C2 n=1 Tax=Oldenlandia corymbosa var. corymbosa TaxID=529605 RepID=A0AAV1BVT0_OLDCO|nr:OLC1v1021484C2 [Oldenlandia corymbosa var. corymbosa]
METSRPDGKRRMKEVGKVEEGEEELAAEDTTTIGEDSKRRRAAFTVPQKKVSGVAAGGPIIQPSCQVEDCRADLKDAKPYHRRHKVCEHHSKAPLVLIAGIRQRFCQQCSRSQ